MILKTPSWRRRTVGYRHPTIDANCANHKIPAQVTHQWLFTESRSNDVGPDQWTGGPLFNLECDGQKTVLRCIQPDVKYFPSWQWRVKTAYSAWRYYKNYCTVINHVFRMFKKIIRLLLQNLYLEAPKSGTIINNEAKWNRSGGTEMDCFLGITVELKCALRKCNAGDSTYSRTQHYSRRNYSRTQLFISARLEHPGSRAPKINCEAKKLSGKQDNNNNNNKNYAE